jgi:hypothetical protein
VQRTREDLWRGKVQTLLPILFFRKTQIRIDRSFCFFIEPLLEVTEIAGFSYVFILLANIALPKVPSRDSFFFCAVLDSAIPARPLRIVFHI